MQYCHEADATTAEIIAALSMTVVYVEKSTGMKRSVFDALLSETRQKSNPQEN